MIPADAFRGRRALVTGGLGFIGATLCRRLVEAGAAVTVIDSLAPWGGGLRFNVDGIEGSLDLRIADLRDAEAVRQVTQGQDFVFGLAAQTSHVGSMEDPAADLDVNCRAQLALLDAVRTSSPAAKLVFASTRQVYGRPDRLPVDETHPTRPVDVNGVHKVAAEWYHLVYGRAYGMRAAVLRLTNTYGPRMRVRDGHQVFLGLWVRLVIQERPFEVWGGDQIRDFTYVDDAVDAFLLAAASDAADGEVFNVGGERASLVEVARLLVAANGGGEFTTREMPAERARIEIGDFTADAGKIERSLGWRATVGLSAGLTRTLAYYREHGHQYWE